MKEKGSVELFSWLLGLGWRWSTTKKHCSATKPMVNEKEMVIVEMFCVYVLVYLMDDLVCMISF